MQWSLNIHFLYVTHLLFSKLLFLYPPGGSGWIISVRDYADNSSLLCGVATPGKLGLSSSQAFMFFIFDLFKSILFFVN